MALVELLDRGRLASPSLPRRISSARISVRSAFFAKLLLGIFILAVVTFNSSSASAQTDETHKGFWLSFGAGGGWLQSERSATTYFRMGGTPNDRVLFGGQVIHWWRDEYVQHTNISAIATLYPFYRKTNRGYSFREVFMRVGAGVVTSHRFSRDDTGLGLYIGTGIDLRLDNNFFFTPNVDLLFDLFNDSSYASLLVSVGFSWH